MQFPITWVLRIPKCQIFGFWVNVFACLISFLCVCSAVCSDENQASAKITKEAWFIWFFGLSTFHPNLSSMIKAIIQIKKFWILSKLDPITNLLIWSNWPHLIWPKMARFSIFFFYLTVFIMELGFKTIATLRVTKIMLLWWILLTPNFRHYIRHYIRIKS